MNDFLNLISVLQSRAKGDQGITFIESDKKEEFLSYKELFSKSRIILHYLQKKGLVPGDEVVFQIGENKDFISGYPCSKSRKQIKIIQCLESIEQSLFSV
jgi:non-ribosomal peptide synthetase component E (peptide arylation enzyme)